MAERWGYPVAQAMQRHTGCRLPRAPMAAEISPRTMPCPLTMPLEPLPAQDDAPLLIPSVVPATEPAASHEQW